VPAPAVEVVDLVKRYGDLVAVDGLTFTAAGGAVTAVLGPNGAGKTSTVECCEGYRRPDGGTVRVLGLDPRTDGPRLRPRVGVMLQQGGIYPTVRAEEMLRHVAALHAHPLDVAMLVERLGLGSCGRTPFRRLSGGQQQRLSLALAVVGRPELVFLDEPTAGLDPQARRATWELVEELRADGVGVVLTTHYMEEAERLSDHVVVVDHGRVVAQGSPAELTADSAEGLLRFTGPARLDLTSLRAALPVHATVEEVSPGGYQVRGDVDPQMLATVTAWCAAHGVMPEGLHVARRSLEDVFLELTGRQLR
jgi:ABC-2 type transport system ATP-binding protein